MMVLQVMLIKGSVRHSENPQHCFDDGTSVMMIKGSVWHSESPQHCFDDGTPSNDDQGVSPALGKSTTTLF